MCVCVDACVHLCLDMTSLWVCLVYQKKISFAGFFSVACAVYNVLPMLILSDLP